MLGRIQMELAVGSIRALIPLEFVEGKDLRFHESAGDLVEEIRLHDDPVFVEPEGGRIGIGLVEWIDVDVVAKPVAERIVRCGYGDDYRSVRNGGVGGGGQDPSSRVGIKHTAGIVGEDVWTEIGKKAIQRQGSQRLSLSIVHPHLAVRHGDDVIGTDCSRSVWRSAGPVVDDGVELESRCRGWL